MIQKFTLGSNVVVITLDSCRWDAFNSANMPILKSLAHFRCAYAQGTYTYPAHLSMYSGIFPDVREKVPLYNRFAANLFRIEERQVNVPALVSFPKGTSDIVTGFRSRGYDTACLAAIEWFHHPNLRSPFAFFEFTGIHLAKQIDRFLELSKAATSPMFCLINVGETHEPYKYGGVIRPSLRSRARMRSFTADAFDTSGFEKQIEACEYVDRELGRLVEFAAASSESFLFVVCGDHGECFGEDGCFGHGFYHPKVMEVPLGIFSV